MRHRVKGKKVIFFYSVGIVYSWVVIPQKGINVVLKMFGKYELLSLISRGGMAEIYHARMTGLSGFSKDTALKRILPEHSRNEEFVHLFVNEARVAAKLHHANIVQVFDFGDIDGEYYLAMELVDGTDLRKFLRPTQKKHEVVDIELAAFIITQIFKGLHYAHTAKDETGASLYIIHRDLSPHNILMSSSGEVKISDFGIAKAAFTTGITAQGFVRGKLGYMSPEQVAGQPLSQKSDIFSVGVIVYELLTGTRLYKGSQGRKLVQQIAKGEPPDPKSYSHIPPELSSFMLSLLERDPHQRPSAGEALRTLNSTGWNVDKSLYLAELLSLSEQLSPSQGSSKEENAIIENKVDEGPSFPLQKTPTGPTSPARVQGQNLAEMQTLLLAEAKTKNKPKYQQLSEQETLLFNPNSEPPSVKEKKKTPPSSDKERKTPRILGIPLFRIVLLGITAAALVFLVIVSLLF